MSIEQTTPEHYVLSRRRFLAQATKLGLICAMPQNLFAAPTSAEHLQKHLTPFDNATKYNNYYEFSTNKKLVHIIAKEFQPSPWTLDISGLVEQPMSLNINDLPYSEERVLKLRCVEGWSMVVPWQGFSMNALLKLAKPKANAKFVRFIGTYRPSEMIGQRTSSLTWPYTEGLRLDEAMHPLTTIATGMYDKPLPNQNGAPIRLLVPWKYGFKSIKAITKIEVTSEQPETTWNQLAPEEYGFYANVNPNVPHPRWSQRREVPLGQLRKIPTEPFNGYESAVRHLYKGMDLSKHL